MISTLILGGTGEARSLANALAARSGWRVITSLAGVTEAPALPKGEVRVGGFGGATGLAKYLVDEGVHLLIDATHPFAATIGENARVASRAAGVPLLRVMRPPWAMQPGDRWLMVADARAAALQCGIHGGSVFLTLGIKELPAFAHFPGTRFVARVIHKPDPSPIPYCEYLEARGPFELAGEIELMRGMEITIVVAKQSGGEATRPKIDAARALGILVIMIERPPIAVNPGSPVVPDMLSALRWIEANVPFRTSDSPSWPALGAAT